MPLFLSFKNFLQSININVYFINGFKNYNLLLHIQMFNYLRIITFFVLANSVEFVSSAMTIRTSRFGDPCQEDPLACTTLPECWYERVSYLYLHKHTRTTYENIITD